MVKFQKYLKAGVREYWIVDPVEKTVRVHILENGQYAAKIYARQKTSCLRSCRAAS
ncbi:MAG: Uma2 family endonuclease [Treponema sp.]|nr:Uma2 family endonuclease [Treponema sp.]